MYDGVPMTCPVMVTPYELSFACFKPQSALSWETRGRQQNMPASSREDDAFFMSKTQCPGDLPDMTLLSRAPIVSACLSEAVRPSHSVDIPIDKKQIPPAFPKFVTRNDIRMIHAPRHVLHSERAISSGPENRLCGLSSSGTTG